MRETLEDVLIVGGGDVGLLTAISLRQFCPRLDVRVVDDFDQEIPQVGKSTYLEIQSLLHNELDVEEPRFIQEVKPIWKASVYFRDWCGRDPFHYPFDSSDVFKGPDVRKTVEHYVYHYDRLANSPDHLTRCGQLVAQGKSPWFHGQNGDLNRYGKCAYHLNTQRFNGFLRNLAEERGVELVDDAITDVETDGSRIDAIHGEDDSYDADLFVDATGFNRVLRSEQDAQFRDFGFPLDAALNVRIENSLDDIEPATAIETGDHGWFWQIDTYDNRDLGYVFGSEYVEEADAIEEFQAYVDRVAPAGADSDVSAEEITRYDFSSGYYERAWIDNCLAIGNAEGFVEPLQSTALTANTSMAVQLAKLLSSRGRRVDDDVVAAFNRTVERSWESIYDFVAVHYKFADGDTQFWEDVTSMEWSPRVDRITEEFDTFGYEWEVERAEGDGLSELTVFSVPDFYAIMRPMGATSAFYESNDFRVENELVQRIEAYYTNVRNTVASQHLTAREFYEGVMGGS